MSQNKNRTAPALERLRESGRVNIPEGVPIPPALRRNPKNPYDPNGQTIRSNRRRG